MSLLIGVLLATPCLAEGEQTKTIWNANQADELTGDERALAFMGRGTEANRINVDVLRRCLERCELRSLVVLGVELTDEWVETISREKTINSVTLTGMDDVTSIVSFDNLPSLTSLSVQAASFQPSCLDSLGTFRLLTELHISGDDGEGAPPYSSVPASLKSLRLAGHRLAKEKLVKALDNLTQLTLVGMTAQDDWSGTELLSLRRLELGRMASPADVLKLDAPSLKQLDINECDLEDVVLDSQGWPKAIETLSIRECINLRPSHLTCFSPKTVTAIDLERTTPLTDQHLTALSQFVILRVLRLSGVDATPDGFGVIGNLKLNVLALTNSPSLDDVGAGMVLQAELGEVDLSWNQNLTEVTLRHVSDYSPKLSILRLEGCIGIKSLKYEDIEAFEHIDVIDVSDTHCDDDTLVALGRTSVSELDIGRTRVTLKGIRELSETAHNLRKLVITGCPNIGVEDAATAETLLRGVELVR